MPGIRPRGDEPIDKLLRSFKRQIEKTGVMQELKNRRHYLKPSLKKREKSDAARRRLIKLNRKLGLD